MKIGIFLGSPRINGGTYVIYEHASRLKKKGYRVILITQQEVTPEEHAWHSSAHELEWLTLEQAKEEFFDMVLATWWQSPFLLHELQSTHYAYFVQSIESRFFEEPDPTNYSTKDIGVWQGLCEKTYSYALPIITEATWIQEYIYRKHNNYPQLVRDGVRKDIYTAEGKAAAPREPGRFRVLVEGRLMLPIKTSPPPSNWQKKPELMKSGSSPRRLLISTSMLTEFSLRFLFTKPRRSTVPATFCSNLVMWKACSALPWKCSTAAAQP